MRASISSGWTVRLRGSTHTRRFTLSVKACDNPPRGDAGHSCSWRLALAADATDWMRSQVAHIRALLLSPEARLLTLVGTGGTGKTRLALAVAADLVDAFEYGVIFVDLCAALSPADVVPTIARALGLRDLGTRVRMDRICQYLATRELLLVLDNFEHVLGGRHPDRRTARRLPDAEDPGDQPGCAALALGAGVPGAAAEFVLEAHAAAGGLAWPHEPKGRRPLGSTGLLNSAKPRPAPNRALRPREYSK